MSYDLDDDLENHWEQHDEFEGFPRDTQVLACEVPVTINGKNLHVDVEYECEVSWTRSRDGISVERWDECWCSICDEEVREISNITDENGDYYTPSAEEMELIKKAVPALTDQQKIEACEVIDY